LQVSAVLPRIVVGQGFTTRRYTVDGTLRYVGGAVGFGFGAMWMTVGIGSAIACVLLAALGYGVVFVAERAQANGSTFRPASQTAEVEDFLLLPGDEFELDEDIDDEPADDATSPLAAEAEYGWPLSSDAAVEKPTAR
jgi:hypothetical protein